MRRWHKKIRLASEFYAQPGRICSVTIAVRHRRPIFEHPEVASAAVAVLEKKAAQTGVLVYAYCVMPDHVHLVLGASPLCDVITFIGQFKNLTQRAAWACGVEGSFWQRSFWDHWLRAEESVERTVEYVLNNPVRSGLVEHPNDYRYSGSLVFETEKDGGGQAPALQRTESASHAS